VLLISARSVVPGFYFLCVAVARCCCVFRMLPDFMWFGFFDAMSYSRYVVSMFVVADQQYNCSVLYELYRFLVFPLAGSRHLVVFFVVYQCAVF
jgi:hypothetical protein